MARLPRQVVPGYPQHVIVRGANRSACFFRDDDYTAFRAWLLELSVEHGCALHAFVLMTNHVHAMLTPCASDALPALMQRLGRRYVGHVNFWHQRTGPLFEGRYRSRLIATDAYALACTRYIELNPVRAGMAIEPASYAWSSARWHASGSGPASWRPHSSYLDLGSSSEVRARAYRELLLTELDAGAVRAIRPGRPVPGTVPGTAPGTGQIGRR